MLKMQVIGYSGSDAVLKEVNGKQVINFSVAHTDKWKNPDGVLVERTTWVKCAIWDRPNLAPHIKKGTLLLVEGSPASEAYSNKDSELVSNLTLTVHHTELLSSPAQS
jgi:single-strand DNA-binding protein